MPLSEEMLGAYIEGNLDISEEAEVENLLSADDALDSFIDDVIADNDWQEVDGVYFPELPEDFQLPATDLHDVPFDDVDDVVVEDVIVGTLENDETPAVTDGWNEFDNGFVDDSGLSSEICDDMM